MITKSQVGASISIGVVAFGAGVVLGHILGRRKSKVEPEVLTKYVYKKYVSAEEHEDERDAIDSHILDLEAEDAHYEGLSEAAPVESVVNVLRAPEDEADWDWEQEKQARTAELPYVITKSEFFNDEYEFTQDTVTYYAGDGILVDALEKPIYNHTHFIGHNLAFGHGSGDQNVFYVRNEKERMEWEVILDEGRYEVQVLGLEVEHEYEEQDLKHSVRRFVMD
jgi:hypothetical protein